jgi:formate hydrogenlyase subunit 3/multisubunit Na+/H+ antiporter MnhD subunit
MLDIILIILILIAIILMIYSLEERRIALLMLDAGLWLIIALFMIQGVEIPYEMFNATSGNIQTGIHKIQTNLDVLAYVFMGLGLLMFIATITMALESLGDERNKVK